MELPYLSGKTIKTISTIGCNGIVDEVHITFTDGQTLVISGPHINLSLFPAASEEPAASSPFVSAVSSGLAARALKEAWEKGEVIEIPSLGIKVKKRSVWPGEKG